MDPGTIISIVQITGSALKYLAETAKELKNAPNNLALVYEETRKLHLQMERLQVMQQMLPLESQAFLDKQVSTVECRATIDRLATLASQIKPQSKIEMSGRFKWLWNKQKVDELVEDLRKEISRLSQVLPPEQLNQLLLTTSQIVGVSNRIHEKIERVLESVSQLQLKQTSNNVANPSFDQNGIYSPFDAVKIEWYGQWKCKPGQDFSTSYFRDRSRLANAAWSGHWEVVERILQHAQKSYKQNWINTTRLYEAGSAQKQSGFTVLHQAAHHGDKPMVEDLIRKGAWRMSRTFQRTGSSREYSTPLDVARNLDWKDLFEILSPVIRRPVTPKTLQALHQNLHELIHREFGSLPGVHLECFNLPELEILTEFDRSKLWFPLNPEILDRKDVLGVFVILDRSELVVSLRTGCAARQNYSISESGITEIEQALVLS